MKRALLRWTAMLAASAAVIFLAVIPFRPDPYSPWWEREWRGDPDLLEAGRALRAASMEEERLQGEWLRAHGRAVALASARRAGPGLTVIADPTIPAATRTRFDSVARAELRGSGVAEPRYPVLVALEPDEGLRTGFPYERLVVLPQGNGLPCTIVLRLNKSRSERFGLHPEDRLLGTCAFYAAYGAPGAGTVAWLRETRGRTSGYLQPPASQAADTGRLDLHRSQLDWPLSLRGCRSGRPDACAAVISPTRQLAAPFDLPSRGWYEEFIPRGWEPSDVVVRWPGSLSSSLSPLTHGLLGGLARELGSERFGTLWRSERGLVEEFTRQEGGTVADWTERYVLRHVPPHDPGPGIPALPLGFAVAMIAAGALLAGLRARRELS